MKTLTVLAILVLPLMLAAQPIPDTLWTKVINGSADNPPLKIRRTTDGGLIVLRGRNLCLLKLDSLGNTQWQCEYPYGHATSVCQTADGGYAICGDIAGLWMYKPFVARLNSAGDTLWTHRFDGSANLNANPRNILETTDHGFLFSGDWGLGGGGAGARFFFKISAQGDSLWSSVPGSDGPPGSWSSICDMEVIADRRIISVGAGVDAWFQFPNGPWHYDYFGDLQRLSASANECPITGGLSGHSARSVSPAEDGGYMVLGTSMSDHLEVWKFRSTDSLAWATEVWGDAGDIRPAIGNGFVTIGTVTTPSDSDQIQLRRFDSTGVERWSETFGGPGNEHAIGIENTDDGGYIIAGTTTSYGAGGTDIYLIRIAPDFPLATEEKLIAAPSSFALSCFPNPFNPTTSISFTLSEAQRVRLAVFDITGRCVREVMNEVASAGEHQIAFDGADLPSGIYFAQVEAAGMTRVQKMVLLK